MRNFPIEVWMWIVKMEWLVDIVGFCLVQYPPSRTSSDSGVHFTFEQRTFRWRTGDFCFPTRQRLYHTRHVAALWSKSFFLRWIIADPSPLKELHSTDQKKKKKGALRDRGESWACLPVNGNERIHSARVCDTDMWWLCGDTSFFLRRITADPSPWENFTPPMKHECGETLGNLKPVYDLFPITSEFALPEAVTQTCMRRPCRKGPIEKVVIFTVNHHGTSRQGNLTGETWSRRDRGACGGGGGLLNLFKTCFRSPKRRHKKHVVN